MTLFHSLRSSPWLARWALLWFVLTLGVAVGSPVVNPPSELVVCSSVGVHKIVLNDDMSTTTSAVQYLSCPLCLMGYTPPFLPVLGVVLSQLLSHVLYSRPQTPITVLSAAPSPARGPPPH